jgi:hypothetical protein
LVQPSSECVCTAIYQRLTEKQLDRRQKRPQLAQLDYKLGVMSEAPNINVTRVSATPNECHIEEQLNIEIDFTTDKPIAKGWWEIKYNVDFSSKRHIIGMNSFSSKCKFVRCG